MATTPEPIGFSSARIAALAVSAPRVAPGGYDWQSDLADYGPAMAAWQLIGDTTKNQRGLC
jgi:hypothetical protein